MWVVGSVGSGGSGGFWWVLVSSFGFLWGGPQKKLPIRTHQNLSEPIPLEFIKGKLGRLESLRNLVTFFSLPKLLKFPNLTNRINRRKPRSKVHGKGNAKKRVQTEVWTLSNYPATAKPEAVVSMREITQPRSRAS